MLKQSEREAIRKAIGDANEIICDTAGDKEDVVFIHAIDSGCDFPLEIKIPGVSVAWFEEALSLADYLPSQNPEITAEAVRAVIAQGARKYAETLVRVAALLEEKAEDEDDDAEPKGGES
jgi:hypothetical protein